MSLMIVMPVAAKIHPIQQASHREYQRPLTEMTATTITMSSTWIEVVVKEWGNMRDEVRIDAKDSLRNGKRKAR